MPRLGQILVGMGACSGGDVEAALSNQLIFGARLGTNLLLTGAVREDQLGHALRFQHGTSTVWGELVPQPGAVALARRDLIERYEAVPFQNTGRRVVLLVCDPRDCQVLDDMAFAIGRPVQPVAVPEARLWRLLSQWYGIRRGLRGIGTIVATSLSSGRAASAARPSRVPANQRMTDCGVPAAARDR